MRKKSLSSDSLVIKDKKFVWHPYTQMKIWNSQENNIIVKGDEFYLINNKKKKILDGIASMWCNVWGYGKNPVVNSMITQLNELPNSTLFGLGNKTSVILAEKLIKLAKGMDKVFYSDNGSTAIEIGLKMAIQYWKNKKISKKTKFLSLTNGYHGDTIATMSVGYVGKYFNLYKPILLKTFRTPSPRDYEKKYENDQDLVNVCLDKTEQILKKHSGEIAAMIMESGAQIAGGVTIYPKNYQKKISELCKKYDILLILDEIATGFGRLGNIVEYKVQNSIPDLVCYGKALNGGYFPIAVTLTTKEIYNEFLGNYSENKQFFHGHTYTGHPVGCAACISNIELYRKYGLIKQIRENGRYLNERLLELNNISIIAKIKNKGLLCGIELQSNKKPLNFVENQPIGYFVMKESLKRGVFLRTLGNIITLIPPLAIPRRELTKLIDIQYDILKLIEKTVS